MPVTCACDEPRDQTLKSMPKKGLAMGEQEQPVTTELPKCHSTHFLPSITNHGTQSC